MESHVHHNNWLNKTCFILYSLYVLLVLYFWHNQVNRLWAFQCNIFSIIPTISVKKKYIWATSEHTTSHDRRLYHQILTVPQSRLNLSEKTSRRSWARWNDWAPTNAKAMNTQWSAKYIKIIILPATTQVLYKVRQLSRIKKNHGKPGQKQPGVPTELLTFHRKM